MPAPKNTLKAALRDGRQLNGLWLALGSETVTEIAGRAGFDWCLVDGEHGPWDPTGIRRQLMVLASTETPAIVRVPVNADWVIKQALDIGAQSVMVPMVHSADEARAAVAACRYPPLGVRGNGGATIRAGGFGAIPDYTATANDEICVIVQAESRAALDDLPAIAAVEGVDCVFIGPADLAADMGYRDELSAPPVMAAVRAAIATITGAGKMAGIIGPADMTADAVAAGARLIGLGADSSVLTAALRQTRAGAP